jgi:hypothetical protein
LSDPLASLAARLGLSDDETLAVFSLDPLAAIGGAHDHRPEIAILDELCLEAADALGPGALARWARIPVAGEAPIELLLSGRFAAFEDALARRVADATA